MKNERDFPIIIDSNESFNEQAVPSPGKDEIPTNDEIPRGCKKLPKEREKVHELPGEISSRWKEGGKERERERDMRETTRSTC